MAIKCLSKEKLHTGMADFLKEATIMHAIDHEHIVRLYGVVLHNEALMLVSAAAAARPVTRPAKLVNRGAPARPLAGTGGGGGQMQSLSK